MPHLFWPPGNYLGTGPAVVAGPALSVQQTRTDLGGGWHGNFYPDPEKGPPPQPRGTNNLPADPPAQDARVASAANHLLDRPPGIAILPSHDTDVFSSRPSYGKGKGKGKRKGKGKGVKSQGVSDPNQATRGSS